ncbi:aspartate ammonia-lyase [Thermoproteota archaeon]
MSTFRREHDILGEVDVPTDAYYGSFTLRARDNFQISDTTVHMSFIETLALVKKASAYANHQLGTLKTREYIAISEALDEVIKGQFEQDLRLDVFQAGAGTPWNMNMNEVVANRANEILGAPLGSYSPVHPNDHVNMSQSSNDVIPNTLRLSYLRKLQRLIDNLERLDKSFRDKAQEYKEYRKTARTHMRDAVPISLGQEFNAYANNIRQHVKQIKSESKDLQVLFLGGTAVGTGINTHPKYSKISIEWLSEKTGLGLEIAEDKVQKTQFMNDFLTQMNSLSTLCGSLIKICNDLMILSSGPTSGLQEINLPSVEPGSSIMPGKVNPSILECVMMVCFQVQGNRHTVELATQAGAMDLNVYTPVIVYNLLDSLNLLTNTVKLLDERCIMGITANKDRLNHYFEASATIGTLLNPIIGYEKVAKLVSEATKLRTSILELALKKKYLTQDEVEKLVKNSTEPNLRVQDESS